MDKEVESGDIDNGINIWHWDNMDEEEDVMWQQQDAADNDQEELTHSRKALSFEQVEQLTQLVEICGGDEELCKSKLVQISRSEPFTDVESLAAVLKASIGPLEASTETVDDSMILLNLLYAPSTSRLSSLLRTLVRVENAGQICAWTKSAHLQQLVGNRGCPSIDLVEIPRLKLGFTARTDYAGELRLYSIDHADLFVSNERNPSICSMLDGLPHSLLLSTLQGEKQILVPVIKPVRIHLILRFDCFFVCRFDLPSKENLSAHWLYWTETTLTGTLHSRSATSSIRSMYRSHSS